MSAWYARPVAPTAVAEVGRARAARSASFRWATRALGWCERSGRAGRRAAYADCRTREAATETNAIAMTVIATPAQTRRDHRRRAPARAEPALAAAADAAARQGGLPLRRRAMVAPQRHAR